MNIVIKDNQAYQRTIDFNQVYLNAYMRLSNRLIYFWLTAGVILITLDIVTFNDKPFRFGNNEPFSLHIPFGAGVACFYLVLGLVSRKYKEKNKFLNILHINAPRLFNPSNIETTIINDHGINYECDGYKAESKWILFTGFTILKDYLVIYRQDSSVRPHYIYKKLLTDNDLKELVSFLKQTKKEIDQKKFPQYD
jgi:hypothetical protein